MSAPRDSFGMYPRAVLEAELAGTYPATDCLLAVGLYDRLTQTEPITSDQRYQYAAATVGPCFQVEISLRDPTLEAEAAALAEYRGTQAGYSLYHTNPWHEKSIRSLKAAEDTLGEDFGRVRAETHMLHSRAIAVRMLNEPDTGTRATLADLGQEVTDVALAVATEALPSNPAIQRYIADLTVQRTVIEIMGPYGSKVKAARYVQTAVKEAGRVQQRDFADDKRLRAYDNPIEAAQGAVILVLGSVGEKFHPNAPTKRLALAKRLVN